MMDDIKSSRSIGVDARRISGVLFAWVVFFWGGFGMMRYGERAMRTVGLGLRKRGASLSLSLCE